LSFRSEAEESVFAFLAGGAQTPSALPHLPPSSGNRFVSACR
jgi:hypothetical protein